MKTQVFAARIKEKKKLLSSSSGGMFLALSEAFLQQGYAVACAIYDVSTQQTVFRMIDCREEQALAQGSKYMQSIPAEIFRESIRWLKKNKGKKLLFIGMGCQADAFKKYAEINRVRDRVLVVDIICHGMPSPKIWKEYALLLEKSYGGKIEYLTFKDKRNGWNNPYAYVKIGENEIDISEYVNLFYSKCILRPSCHRCPYTTVHRDTDMTIGDYWGIEKVLPDFYSPEGNSLVLIHTEMGKQFFESIKLQLDFRESNVEDCLQPNLLAPTPMSEKRNKFWKTYFSHGLLQAMKIIYQTSLIDKIKDRLKNN